MAKKVFITATACCYPNNPVDNDSIEDYLGLISGKHSRVKNIVLRQNQIKTRYYALDKNQQMTHTNAELAAEAIHELLKKTSLTDQEVELLACATASADQILPSHASMVHGKLKNKPMEIFSSSGICLTCLQAFKIACLSIQCGEKQNAVCSCSELASPGLLSKNYDIEYEKCNDLGVTPYMALEKDFLRFMLSDASSAVLLQDAPLANKSLLVEWVDMTSYANEAGTCMAMGGEHTEDGELKSWKAFSGQELVDRSLMAVRQDIKLLEKKVIPLWIRHIEECLAKHHLSAGDITYVIPHVSSMFFWNKLIDGLQEKGINLKEEQFYTNLTRVGNIASAAIFSALDEFMQTHELHSGETILLLVPESGRFSYGSVLLSVV